MKFLCVNCDEPMALRDVGGPLDGTMSIVYACPNCTREIAMLTNQSETQLVRSLGVKIGGRKDTAMPMETLRTKLAAQREELEALEPSASEPKCPFTGMVSDAFAQSANEGLTWSTAALARMGAIPPFVQPMVKKNVEDYAREKGYAEVTESVLDEVKGHLAM